MERKPTLLASMVKILKMQIKPVGKCNMDNNANTEATTKPSNRVIKLAKLVPNYPLHSLLFWVTEQVNLHLHLCAKETWTNDWIWNMIINGQEVSDVNHLNMLLMDDEWQKTGNWPCLFNKLPGSLWFMATKTFWNVWHTFYSIFFLSVQMKFFTKASPDHLFAKI